MEKYDIAIIGCGPAGLSAAINAKIRNKTIFFAGGDFCTPKLHSAPWVENYLGFTKISGEDLRTNFLKHIQDMDIKLEKLRIDMVTAVGEGFFLQIKDRIIDAKAVILSTGVTSGKRLPGEEDLIGRGVSYCATCDGMLFKGKKVAVLGYHHEAVEEANFLEELCEKVYFFHLGKGKFEGLKASPKLEERTEKVKGFKAGENLEALELEEGLLEVDGAFIVRESVPPTQLVPGLEIEGNIIKVNRNMETNIPGLFAAGDCTGGPYQLAKAVGEGQVAALNAVKYLDKMSS